jgi:hypothetical protein
MTRVLHACMCWCPEGPSAKRLHQCSSAAIGPSLLHNSRLNITHVVMVQEENSALALPQ